MGKSMSMSVSAGSVGGHRHNVEAEYREGLANVAPERTGMNLVLVDRGLEAVYRDRFGEAVEAYNARQKRPERRIDDYLAKIRASKQEHASYEMVVQIGNRDTNPADDPECRAVSAAVYRRFLDEFRARFPNLDVVTAAVHMDEATPHLHLEYVPWVEGGKRGLPVKNSLRGALKAMGTVNDQGRADVRELNRRLFQCLENVAEEVGIERVEVGYTRGRLTVNDYKALQEEIQADGYSYANDPRLIQLLDEQQAELERACEVIARQQGILADVTELHATWTNHRSLNEALAAASEASKALFGDIDGIKGAVSRFKAVLDVVPSLWRECVLNPVSEALRAAREAFLKPREECEEAEDLDPDALRAAADLANELNSRFRPSRTRWSDSRSDIV